MSDIIVKEKKIKDMIYEIRGKQVLLDSDLALLYETETKRINEAVKNNPNKFPERFCFRLTDEESKSFLVEIFDQKNEKRGGKYKNPRVFTEQGVAMLATVLKSKKATEVSIAIMDAFVAMRKFINNNKDIFKRVITMENNIQSLTDKTIVYDKQFDKIFNKLESKEYFKEKLFYDGEIYEAYSLLIDIIKQAKTKIIIIDNYIDKTIFDILKYKDDKVKVEIYTKHIKSNLDITKFKKEYKNITIKKVSNFHDRFIIIDNNTLYHVGASLKDLGSTCFGITKMDNHFIKNVIAHLK